MRTLDTLKNLYHCVPQTSARDDPEIGVKTKALVASYGASDTALLDDLWKSKTRRQATD